MDLKHPTASSGFYKETRLDLDPSAVDSIIHIQLPSLGPFARNTKLQRRVINALPVCKTEEDFKRRNVAFSGSIHFRRSHIYPRAILFRCLEENNVVELRSVDLSKGENQKRDANSILRIGFPCQLRDVAMADSVEQDVLNVFLLTDKHEIYVLALRPDFFCRPDASTDDVERWCKVFKPSTFSLGRPHRLIACSPLELLVSLGDGGLVRLSRNAGEDGSKWEERVYNGRSWGATLRGIVPWQSNNTVLYNGNVLDHNTAVEAQLSPDKQHILAVCMNHTLTALNVETGRPTFTKDLLDIQREPQDLSRITLDPGRSSVMVIFEANAALRGDQYYVATFSPQQSGVFKFWGVRDANHPENGVRDMFSDILLQIPDPDDGALWTMMDFKLKTTLGSGDIEVWILVRLNRRYKLYHKITTMNSLATKWDKDWSITITESSRLKPFMDPLPVVSDNDMEGSTEKWLQYVLTPGRVPESVLEAGLLQYSQSRRLAATKNSKASLQERLASCVGSHIQLDVSNGRFAQYHEQVNMEWIYFWSIVGDLDHNRWEPLSLALDETAGMPWLTFGDGCSAIRMCSEVERLAYNKADDLMVNRNMLVVSSIEHDGHDGQKFMIGAAALIEAAAKFRRSFSESLQLQCRKTLEQELWQECVYSVPVRIQSFYDRCDFANEISDKQYNELSTDLQAVGGFQGLTTDLFLSLLDVFLQPMSTEVSGLLSTKFGLKLLVNGAQEMITLYTRILNDLLLLVVFIDAELDPDEYPMEDYDVPQVYTSLLDLLKQYQLLRWLVTTTRLDSDNQSQTTSNDFNSASIAPARTTTVLENLFAVDTRPQTYTNQNQSEATTRNIEDLLKWVTGGNDPAVTLERVLVNIQCNLLKKNNVDLASSFLLFQPYTAWATYFRARLCLLCNDFTSAAIFFKKAAYKLSRPDPQIDYTLASSHLLDPLSAAHFSSGLANYYAHILSLFESMRAHSHTQHFAHLALQFSPPFHPPDQTSDLLSRLFHASLALSDFDSAYSALTRYTDPALQKSCLRRLVSEMVSQGYVEELLALPFTTLRLDVDTLLAEHATHELHAAPPPGSAVPFYKILYAWRLRQGDVRGAAAVLVERLEARAAHPERQRAFRAKDEESGVLEEYLVAINALGLVGEEAGWVLVGGEDEGEGSGGGGGGGRAGEAEGEKRIRKVVRLEDVRRGYQAELDRRSVIEGGRFGIVGAEEMDFS